MAKQSVRLTNASVVAGLNNKVDLDYNNALVTSTNTNTPRHLSDRFSDIVNVKDFGAVGDGVTDDTASIQSALNAGAITSKMVFFPAGEYIVSGGLTIKNTVPFSVFADNATLKLVCSSSIRNFLAITASADVDIKALHLDGNRKCFSGLYIIKATDATDLAIDVNISNVKIENIYRASTEFNGGDGIAVWGGFQNVRIISPIVKNCASAVGDGIVDQNQAVSGITVSRLDNKNIKNSPTNIWIENPYIENIYSEDSTLLMGSNGIRCFSVYNTEHANPHTFSIIGGYIKNVRGRIIKGQTDSCYIDGLTVENTEDPAGFFGVLPQRSCIEMQVGAGNISNIAVFTTNILWRSFVHMALDSESFSYNGGGNVSNIRAICYGFSQEVVNDSPGHVVSFSNNNTIAGQPYSFNVSNITIESDFDFQYFVGVMPRTTGQRGYINATNIAARLYGACFLLQGMDSPVCAQACNALNLGENIVPLVTRGSTVHKAYGLHLRGILTGDTMPTAPCATDVTAYSPVSTDGHVVIGTNTVWARILGGGESGSGNLALGNVAVPNLFTFIPTVSMNTLSIGNQGSNFFRLRGSQDEAILPSIEPYNSGKTSLGTASYKWSELYASTDTINTSDAREKTSVSDPNESLMKAWGKVNFKTFQFIDAVEKKGSEEARVHFGVIAQQVQEAFASEGLDASKYALFCYDKWDNEYEDVEVIDTEATYDENGNELTPQISHTEKKLVTPAGDRYGIRYSEALALECAYQRWRLNKLEEKLNNL